MEEAPVTLCGVQGGPYQPRYKNIKKKLIAISQKGLFHIIYSLSLRMTVLV